jgi:uncharacterized membrane protein YkvA (DUF1232 family)
VADDSTRDQAEIDADDDELTARAEAEAEADAAADGGGDLDPRTTSYFEPFMARARTLLAREDNAAALDDLASRSQRRLAESRDPFIMNVRDRGDRLCRLVKAFGAGMAPKASPEAVELAVATLVYLLSPTDLIPDSHPAGQSDDAAVISYAARVAADDIARTLG